MNDPYICTDCYRWTESVKTLMDFGWFLINYNGEWELRCNDCTQYWLTNR